MVESLKEKLTLAMLRQSPELVLRMADSMKARTIGNYDAFLESVSMSPDVLYELSPHAAIRAARQTHERVSAYRQLADEHNWKDDEKLPPRERLKRLPVTDKKGYILRFSTEERCLDGRIPYVGTQVDESAGSTGIPYNWVRSSEELRELHSELQMFARMLFGENLFTINGFSMGAWATGVNAGEAMRANGIVKSTGPDLEKILHTLKFFGPRYRYVITGYPPFLKHLVDVSESRGFDWNEYTIFGTVGGEGMSEGLREYLERRFKAVYSAYGASDLDIGVSAELPLTVWIRKQAMANRELHKALFGDDPRLPMLFQYNPLDYYIETSDENELIVTINRLKVLSPRIRYNVHDAGGVIPFDKMISILKEFGLDPFVKCNTADSPIFPLPFMYIFGRADNTLSYMGANIYPEDVEQALFSNADDARKLGAFTMELLEVGNAEMRPCVHVELAEGGNVNDGALAGRLKDRILKQLMENNRDFQSAVSEDASVAELRVKLHQLNTGPFVMNSNRIKRKYIVKTS